MDIKHITSDSLRRLLSLTDKKEQLIQAVSDLESEIAKTFKGAATTAVEVAESVTPFKPTAQAQRKAKSGGLKSRILALLEAAGDEGLRVKDIASKLGTKAPSVSVWFSTTGKGITTKIEPGRFAKNGVAKPVAAVAEEKAGRPVKKVRKARSAKRGGAVKKKLAEAGAKPSVKKAGKKPLKKAAARPAKFAFKLPKTP